MFAIRFCQLIEQGTVTQDEADAFQKFIDMSNVPSFNLYIYAKLGQLQHLEGDEGYEASKSVMEKLGLSNVEFSRETAMPYEQQFWEQFDIIMGLSEDEMRQELPNFITDPSNQAKVDALLADKSGETNQKLSA